MGDTWPMIEQGLRHQTPDPIALARLLARLIEGDDVGEGTHPIHPPRPAEGNEPGPNLLLFSGNNHFFVLAVKDEDDA